MQPVIVFLLLLIIMKVKMKLVGRKIIKMYEVRTGKGDDMQQEGKKGEN